MQEISANGNREGPSLSKEEQTEASLRVEPAHALVERTEAIARHLAAYMRNTDPWAKTIIFCVTRTHAGLMAEAVAAACRELEIGCDGYVETHRLGGGHRGQASAGPLQPTRTKGCP